MEIAGEEDLELAEIIAYLYYPLCDSRCVAEQWVGEDDDD